MPDVKWYSGGSIAIGSTRIIGGTSNRLLRNDGSKVQNSLLSDDGTNITLASGAFLSPDWASGAAVLRGTTHATYGIGITSAGVVTVVADTSGGGLTVGQNYGTNMREVSAIGAVLGGAGANQAGFIWDANAVWPARNFTTGDNLIDLGTTSYRFRTYYASTSYALRGANGQSAVLDRFEEAHTLAAAATSDTTATIPANSRTQGAVFRITTSVTGCTSIDVGVAGATNRFGSFSTITAGQTLTSTDTSAYAAATAIRFTAVGGGASFTAGAIRVTPFYDVLTAPTS